MHRFARLRNTLLVVLLVLIGLADTADAAKPKPGVQKRGFRLFAGVRSLMQVNRVQCGVNSAKGEVCVDITGSTVLGGGFWPRGTPDQYVFNSGLQVAGVIDPAAGFAWAGDTTGAFFFDPKGTTEHGEGVEPVYNTTDPEDFTFISDSLATDPVALAARVPSGDANEELFNPLLRGRTAASQGDFWFLAWEGNPGLNAGRSHALGLLVETRGMGWNFPSGNEDIIYLIYTFYNVTSLDPAAYAAVRPGMRDILLRQAEAFHDRNEAAFGIDIPDAGYGITSLFAAFATDPDVAEATTNFASVNVPFAMGFVYEDSFDPASGWIFDPAIFSPPFFPGSGFFGVKYLKSPEIAPGVEAGLSLYSNTINGGDFNDAQNTIQLYRYLSNNISPAAGDAPCNTGDPQDTNICFVNVTAANDMRFFQSSGPLNLAPGQFGSIVVAYVFAAPRATGSCSGPGTCTLNPGDPTLLSDIATAGDANPVDSVAGYLGFSDDGDGVVEQSDFQVAPRSLYGKALVAQQVFDGGFLLPFAPESPNFFLIPGSNQVTVVWQPSATETTGDPFFEIASSPLNEDLSENLLFDPNYRQIDVEGYRVYRGRVDNPNELSLLASFDYSGTTMPDFQGQVNPVGGCAPELGINVQTITPNPDNPLLADTTFACPVDFDSLQAGIAPTVSIDVPLVGSIVQVKRGERTTLAIGEAINLVADTALTGAASACLEDGDATQCSLRDTDIPFTFTDLTARNNLRYFYSVTAFDINSFQSGPSSLESARTTKSVTPSSVATNVESTLDLTPTLTGRGQALNFQAANPTLDPATLTFSGPFPPANGWDLGFVSSLPELLSGSGSFSVRLDSIALGNIWHDPTSIYHYTATTSEGSTAIAVPVAQDFVEPDATGASTPFSAAVVDASASRFGGSSDFALYGQLEMTLPGSPHVNGFGRIVALGPQTDGAPALSPENGPRWFEGDNETTPHPTANYAADPSTDFALYSNAGTLSGVTLIHSPQAYLQGYGGAANRDLMGIYAGAARAADFKFYWGAGGVADSVIDVTHNVVVPFDTAFGGGYGFLTPASATNSASNDSTTGVVTAADFMCVAPGPQGAAGGNLACGAAALAQPYKLVPAATIAPIQISPTAAGVATDPPPGQEGFGLYMPGHAFIFGASAVPAAGTVWTLRTFTGAIAEDNTFVEAPRPLTAVGVEAAVAYQATNQLAVASSEDLSRIHTVPDPYYVTNAFEQSTDTKILKFVNLPNDAIIRIYSSGGVLVTLLEHHSAQNGGSLDWNVRNRNNQVVASGVYFYHIEAGDARRVGRFTVVNFAQ
jgi:hypothetical protein